MLSHVLTCSHNFSLLLLLVLLRRLGLVGPYLLNELLDALEPLLLLLGGQMQLVDLLDDQLLDLLLHNRRLLLDDLLSFAGFLLYQSTVLSFELTDQFLDLAFLLSLVSLVGEQSVDARDEFTTQFGLAEFQLLFSFGFALLHFLDVVLAEVAPGVVQHRLLLWLIVITYDFIDSLLEILASYHDVLKVRETNCDHRYRGNCPRTVDDLIHCQTTDHVECLTSVLAVFHWNRILILQ